MKVYHGSYTEIVEIDLFKCEKNKDFGQGFYVTKNKKHAEEWAERIGNRNHTAGVITEFEFGKYLYLEKDFNILRFPDYTEEWLDFVVLNRSNKADESAHEYDFIEGPIADDKISRRIYDYLDGIVSKTDFLNELKYHEPTHQICFCTIKSLQLISKPNRKPISAVETIVEYIVMQLVEDKKITEEDAVNIFYNSNTFVQLTNETTELYQKDWTEIYKLLLNELKL
ncbi:DUF3990 domain-containing protein [Fluviicola sp.]|jgi:hypothetical protein|uniref:DUF3990 domain-containing protein n=1 Tax=Fluviicola sp. TaxID=1917219 RepID=UPI0028186E8B|nr:DUF3990 domain-containing protein [Fluviicola sp.]MDR0802793.1 DUF3990 domain-containing protein [Fluviicola sp.]